MGDAPPARTPPVSASSLDAQPLGSEPGTRNSGTQSQNAASGLSAASTPSSLLLAYSLNVGPSGFISTLPLLVPLFKSRPAVVMMQDTKLNDRSLQTAKKKVRQLLPEYCLYVHLCPTDERGSIAKTAILLHRALTHAAAPYDLGNLCKGDPQFSREQWVNTQVLHHKDPHTGMTALWVNAYCPTSDHPSSQADTLKNVSSILRMLSERHDLVVLGGDWNASLHVRSRPGGRALQEADRRLRDWVEQQQLSTVSCTTATFSRYRQDAYHATIDYVFVSKHPLETELQYASTNFA